MLDWRYLSQTQKMQIKEDVDAYEEEISQPGPNFVWHIDGQGEPRIVKTNNGTEHSLIQPQHVYFSEVTLFILKAVICTH